MARFRIDFDPLLEMDSVFVDAEDIRAAARQHKADIISMAGDPDESDTKIYLVVYRPLSRAEVHVTIRDQSGRVKSRQTDLITGIGV